MDDSKILIIYQGRILIGIVCKYLFQRNFKIPLPTFLHAKYNAKRQVRKSGEAVSSIIGYYT